VGSTLAKLAVREADGLHRFVLLPSEEIERAAREVEAIAPRHLGLTGAGASRLAQLLGLDTTPLTEFDAWRAGSSALLSRQGEPPSTRDLVVSVGTGTSMLLVEPERSLRIGGTALGGGTLLGLGAALVGSSDYAELLGLAEGGDRGRVDLLVSDIDADGLLPLPGHWTASFCAKLARSPETADPRDVVHALLGLVGENIGILASTLAAASDARRIVYGGSTLRDNALLRDILSGYAFAREVLFLEDGEFAGALGALELASA